MIASYLIVVCLHLNGCALLILRLDNVYGLRMAHTMHVILNVLWSPSPAGLLPARNIMRQRITICLVALGPYG